jgi:hypothetical protein
MKEKKPLYAVIAYTGKQWTVHFESEYDKNTHSGAVNCTLTGYGDFPTDRFPNIPVIDYTNNDGVFQALKIRDEDHPAEVDPISNYGTVKGYLLKVMDCGVPVYNWQYD